MRFIYNFILRFLQSNLSFNIMKNLLILKRKFLLKYLSFNNFIISKYISNIEYNSKIDQIYYKNKNNNNNTIVFINGDGFITNDNSDLSLSFDLLPKLDILNPTILSIQYDLNQSYDEINTQILNEYNNIKKNNNVICIIGVSAGGNLALNLLLNLKEKENIKLILISPWINIRPIYNENKKSSYFQRHAYPR
jgi:acetyl esterase/lipase